MYKFSKTSKERLSTAHKDLQLIFEEAIKVSPIDFGVACGRRTIEEQQALYAKGRTEKGSIVTYVDGINNKSKHNEDPSMAVDIYAYYNGSAQWDQKHLCIIAGVIIAVHHRLKEKGLICRELRWGGNWDMDGVIISDQNFQDLPHFELI